MTNLLKFFVIALFISAFCFTANAQYTAAQRQKDEAEIAKLDDVGFDAAFVVKAASIKETAEIKGKILLGVKRGDVLSLAVRESKKNWYNVVDQKTGAEGWIEGGSIVIKFTTNTETGPPLKEEDPSANENADPEVSITNMEEKTALRIRINGTLHTILPKSTKVISVKPGNFSYYGWSPGIRPATGKSVLAKGKKYSWTFKIYNRRS